MEGQKKKRRVDKTSVCGVDFPALQCRTDRKNVRSAIAQHFRSYGRGSYHHMIENTLTQWKTRLEQAQADRAFFGYMRPDEVNEQNIVLPRGTYYIYFSNDGRDGMFAVRVNAGGGIWGISSPTLDETYAKLAGFQTGVPLDRGDALIYTKKASKRALLAIRCWSIIGRRLGVVKDLRVLIAKMVWAEKRVWVK